VKLGAAALSGRVTFVTGPEKGSGKTSLLNYALGLLREAGESPAFLGVGFDGEAGDATSRASRIACRSGEVFVSAERFLRSSSCLPEILEALPGSTALGRLAVARARRDGWAVLVGPERNEHTAFAIDAIRSGPWSSTVLVDGAMNRITQVSAFRGARFLFSVRASPGDLERNVRAMARAWALARLPEAGSAPLPEPAYRLAGPLTAQTLARVPPEARSIIVEDFTKVFLDAQALAALSRDRSLAVEAGIEFAGFAVSLRDLPRERFSAALRAAAGGPEIEELVDYEPYGASRG
jgi:hypothetical protein